MIYTIGYDPRLAELTEKLDAVVIDVRARPSGRVKRGWSREDLSKQLGNRYTWDGNNLGGRQFRAKADNWIEAPLEVLGPLIISAEEDEGLILLCACDHPMDCHRHNEIALPLLRHGVEVYHIIDDMLVEAGVLQQAIEKGIACDYYGLSEWLEALEA